ncbi:hypothetical protein Z517_01771 [Fonsecaea pedrosoi CBS 271.37]|uniref:Uncharacterized protein n=1 Tax=Fonsecaea pedrosoi CBS 271.37 TaxID=1442368 RepID=A0A0D2H695_9EURO|nr:uncharacterized protein Z517_01771 [Fonsecaea pedrosoi CBS 271.37]KIW86375.1 hypothetical protein Z517_01771 [Fonsecaea pedrosoi CBS 271.37]
MPHKHKRKRADDDSNFDLPPTSRARTLTVHQKQESIFTSDADKKRKQEARRQQKKKQNGQNGAAFEDDTPKAFRRLMSFQPGGKRMPSGLDDGNISKKKQKQKQRKEDKSIPANNSAVSKPGTPEENSTAAASTEPSDPAPTTAKAADVPKILPGESLASYSRRVDQSLPLTSLPKHRTRLSAIPGLEKIKTPLTKHNKRLARMQSEWRATDQRLKEKREEAEEELAEKKEEDEVLWLGAGIDPSTQVSTLGKSGKKAKKKRSGGGARDVDDADPWKILEKKRREEGQLGRQTNLQDVVAAPPTLKPVKNIFKEKPERKAGMIPVV